MGQVTNKKLEKKPLEKVGTKYNGKYCLENTIIRSENSSHRDYLNPTRRSLMECKLRYAREMARQKKIKILHQLQAKNASSEDVPKKDEEQSKRS